MSKSKEVLMSEIEKLHAEGWEIYEIERKKQKPLSKLDEQEVNSDSEEDNNNPKPIIEMSYQGWYSKALRVIEQLLPDRYDEFVQQYIQEKRKNIDALNYTISDYWLGVIITRKNAFSHKDEEKFDRYNVFVVKFKHQLYILSSCISRVDSILSNIQGTLQAELFDDEISAAEELLEKGHLRAVGALAGVTLERHFATVMSNHQLKTRKKNPTIADYNDLFKTESVYDTPQWRFIQHLGDLRNLAVHNKSREPKKEEMQDLIDGTKKIIKTVF